MLQWKTWIESELFPTSEDKPLDSTENLNELSGAAYSWAKGRSVITHSSSTRLRVERMLSQLVESGVQSDKEDCYQLLYQLDLLSCQCWWMTYQLSCLKSDQASPNKPLNPDDLKITEGAFAESLSLVPAYLAVRALDALTGQRRSYLMDDSKVGAAVAAIQWILREASEFRQHQYPFSQAGWSDLVEDFSSHSSSGKPGPELDHHCGNLTSLVSSSAWAAIPYASASNEATVALMFGSAPKKHAQPKSKAQGLTSLLLFSTAKDRGNSVSGGDPAEILVALYESEQASCNSADRGRVLDASQSQTERKVGFNGVNFQGHSIAQMQLVRPDWIHQLSGLSALAQAQQVKALFGRLPPVWLTKTSLGGVSGFDQSTSTAFQHGPMSLPVSSDDIASGDTLFSVDRFFRRLSSRNPTINSQLFLADPYYRHYFQSSIAGSNCCAHEVSASESISALRVNLSGINLAVLNSSSVPAAARSLNELAMEAHRQSASIQTPKWTGVPFLLRSDGRPDGFNRVLAALLSRPVDTFQIQLPPDTRSVLESLRTTYDQQGVLRMVALPQSSGQQWVTPDQARELAEHGVARLVGPRMSRVQLVVCGLESLKVAKRMGQQLETIGVSHSIVYLMEPGRLRVPRDRTEAARCLDKQALLKLFPSSVGYRLVLSDVQSDLFSGLVKRINQSEGHTAFMEADEQGSGRLATEHRVEMAMERLHQLSGGTLMQHGQLV